MQRFQDADVQKRIFKRQEDDGQMSPMSSEGPLLANKSKVEKEATFRILIERENKERKESAMRLKNNRLAQRSKSRLDDWLCD